jgi:hypothetical protein
MYNLAALDTKNTAMSRISIDTVEVAHATYYSVIMTTFQQERLSICNKYKID